MTKQITIVMIGSLRVKLEYSISYKTACAPSKDSQQRHTEGWAQDYGNSNIFLKPLFRGNLDPFVNNANLGAIAHTSNGT